MAQVHGIAARPPSSVQIELVPLLKLVEDEAEVAVGEEHAAPQQGVHRSLDERLESGNQGPVHAGAAELEDQLFVVDALVRAGLDVPGVHFVLVSLSVFSLFGS